MLAVAEGFSLPDEIVTSSSAILAVKRAGKSNAAVVMAEAMYDAGLPWCAIDPKGDWWGVRSDADGDGPGLSVVIFGGLHGDLPLEPGAGAFIAELLAEQRITCVLDVSEFSKGEQIKFLTAFAERLLKVNRDALHLFLEEADEYIPQKVGPDEARLVGAIGKLVRRGGFRGIGTTLITQRSAVVNKDVLTQTETLYVLRTTSPQDRKAVKEWLEHQAVPEELLASLPGLDNGEAWVASPHVLKIDPTRVRFRRRRTFDSGATPVPGVARVQPKRLADVDLATVKDAMAESIERARANDPKVLQQEIAELRRQLAAQPAPPPPEVERVEVPVLDPDQVRAIVEPLRVLEHAVAAIHTEVTDAAKAVLEHMEHVVEVTNAAADRAAVARRAGAGARPVADRRPSPRAGTPERPGTPAGRDAGGGAAASSAAPEVELTAYARHLLESLAARHPMPLNTSQWSVAADRSTTSSGWDPAERQLRRLGLITWDRGWVTCTPEGLAVAGVDPGVPPPSGADLVDWWCERIPGPAQKVLRLLYEAQVPMSQDAICDALDWSRTSSGPSAAIAALTKLELARREQGLVVLGEPFLG